MEVDAARKLLGLVDELSSEAVERAFSTRKEATEQRLSAAPTETLKAKYRAALGEFEEARQRLLAAADPRPSHLSKTQLGDLPGAQPVLTRMGSTGGTASAASNLVDVGQVLAGRYEIRERIGVGGMGGVYRAYDRNRSEEIALKVLLPHLLSNPAARERFLSEAKLSSKLSHPNIVNVFDVQRDGEHDFLTMELLHGQTLRQVMAARAAGRQGFSVAEAMTLARAIGAALDYAHRHTVHRDVKPENVWVEKDGTYKLMDFGIARLRSGSQLTETRAALGTAYYMAPEQLRGAKDVDGRADQYSLAVMMYEMLSGEIPAGRIKPLRELNKDVLRSVSSAIDRALEPRPGDRFANVTEFLAALSRKPVSGRSAAWLMASTLVVGAAAGAIVYWPQIRALLPDPAAEKALRDQAVEAQGIIDTQLKRLDQAERELATQLRDAKSALDRSDGMMRSARTSAEKEEAARRVEDAKHRLERLAEASELASQHVFRSQDLVAVRGQLAIGAAALRDGQLQKAADQLGTARKTVERLLTLPDEIRDAVMLRGELDSTLSDLRDTASQEKRNVTAELGRIDAIVSAAEENLKSGKFGAAAEGYRKATDEAAQALNALIDALVPGYAKIVDQLLRVGRHNDAAFALKRAKALDGLKRQLK